MDKRINEKIDEEILRVLGVYGKSKLGSEDANAALRDIEHLYKMRSGFELEKLKIDDQNSKAEQEAEFEKQKLEMQARKLDAEIELEKLKYEETVRRNKAEVEIENRKISDKATMDIANHDLERDKFKEEVRNHDAMLELEKQKLDKGAVQAAAEKGIEHRRNLVRILEVVLTVGAKIGIEAVIAKSNYNMFVDLTNFEKDGNMALSRSFKEFMKNGIRVFRSNN